jgi:hypothetical protein
MAARDEMFDLQVAINDVYDDAIFECCVLELLHMDPSLSNKDILELTDLMPQEDKVYCFYKWQHIRSERMEEGA